jgi:2-(1,2-epoxy-1,2-dihydrophenyl)acetyl-CoA isomerase
MIDGTYRAFEVVTYSPGIAVFTFTEPQRLNGFSQGMKRDLVELMLLAQNDDDVRVVVFTGTGRGFSAGDDIFTGDEDDRRIPTLTVPRVPRSSKYQSIHSYGSLRSYSQELTRAVLNLDKPTIAAINGVAIQSGLSLALACDFRIASREARLGSATLRFAYLPDEGGHWLLVRLLGVARAKDFLLRSRIVDAAQAHELGLVNDVVDPDQLESATMALARELALGPAVALRLLKRAIDNAASLTFEQACDDIATKTAISDHPSDTEEGRKAWSEKRVAQFNEWLDDPTDG